jgi:oligopeptide/dipeptide ABC transporter ATP-binding protein
MTEMQTAYEAQLEIRGLRMYFPLKRTPGQRLRGLPQETVRAVDDVDLQVFKGEVLGLVGETGCGKSTLARCLAGLYQSTAGEILLDGVAISEKRSTALRRRIQMVFQDPYSSLNPRMTVSQAVGEILRVHGKVPRSEVAAAVEAPLALVGFPSGLKNAYPRSLSGGLRQRVSIARALACDPEILLADEPVSALDVSVQATILNLLDDLRRRLSLTMLLITHDMGVVRHLSDRVAVMYLGRIVETAPAEELFTNPRHPYTVALLSAVPHLQPGRGVPVPSVTGDPPSPIRLPSGRRYNPRCPLAQDVCRTEDPRLTTGTWHPGHAAACHFADQVDELARSVTARREGALPQT